MLVDAPSRSADLESERWRLQDAIGNALRSLCAIEPVIVIVDDLHWPAPPPSTFWRACWGTTTTAA